MNCTYFNCDSSCLDNEIIDRHFDFFWKEKEWLSDFCHTYTRPADLDPSDQDLDDSVLPAAAASVSSRPLMRYQTVMNAAISNCEIIPLLNNEGPQKQPGRENPLVHTPPL